MPRLNISRTARGGVPPEEADASHIKMYLSNSVWHLGYCAKAFEADGMPDVAKICLEAQAKAKEAIKIWRSK